MVEPSLGREDEFVVNMMIIPEYLYRRGVLRWNADRVSNVMVDGEPLDTPVIGYVGSEVFQEMPLGYDPARISFTAVLNQPDASSEPLYGVEWINSEEMPVTRIWTHDGEFLTESHLLYSLGLGTYHRFVISVPNLKWYLDRVFRLEGCLVRFRRGDIGGNRFRPNETMADREGLIAKSSQGPDTVSGKFVEVISRGTSALDAKQKAGAVFGILAMVFGKKLIGAVLFDEAVEVTSTEEFSHSIATTIDFAYDLKLTDIAFDMGAKGVEQVIVGERRAVVKALERYFAGLSSGSLDLQLIAYHSGIELIVREFERSSCGTPTANHAVEKYGKGLEKFLNSTGDIHLKEKLMASLRNSSVKTAFGFYCDQHSLDSALKAQFAAVSTERNGLSHSGGSRDIHQLVADAKNVIQQLVASELGLDSDVFWNSFDDFKISGPMTSEKYGFGRRAMEMH